MDYNFFRFDLLLGEGSCPAGLEELLCVEAAEQFDQFSHQAGPSGLMTGSETCSIVTVEVLVEQDVVLPLRVCLEFLRTTVHRAPAGFIPQKDSGQTVGDLARDLEK